MHAARAASGNLLTAGLAPVAAQLPIGMSIQNLNKKGDAGDAHTTSRSGDY